MMSLSVCTSEQSKSFLVLFFKKGLLAFFGSSAPPRTHAE